jgi:hypothetical protein
MLKVAQIKIVLDDGTEVIVQNNGDLVELDWIGGEKQRIVVGTDDHKTIATQIIATFVATGNTPLGLTDHDHRV